MSVGSRAVGFVPAAGLQALMAGEGPVEAWAEPSQCADPQPLYAEERMQVQPERPGAWLAVSPDGARIVDHDIERLARRLLKLAKAEEVKP